MLLETTRPLACAYHYGAPDLGLVVLPVLGDPVLPCCVWADAARPPSVGCGEHGPGIVKYLRPSYLGTLCTVLPKLLPHFGLWYLCIINWESTSSSEVDLGAVTASGACEVPGDLFGYLCKHSLLYSRVCILVLWHLWRLWSVFCQARQRPSLSLSSTNSSCDASRRPGQPRQVVPEQQCATELLPIDEIKERPQYINKLEK
jgi:hypothetical protein